MSYFSIRVRLIFLAFLLLAILAATLALLTRELARDSQALADEARLVSIVRNANNASKHFGDLKYWLTDLAVTLAASSQQNASAAKTQLDGDLKSIAPVDRGGRRRRPARRQCVVGIGGEGGRRLLLERRQRGRKRNHGAGSVAHPRCQ